MSSRNTYKILDSSIFMENIHCIHIKQSIPGVGLSNNSNIPQQESPIKENMSLSKNSCLRRSTEPMEFCVINVAMGNLGIMEMGFMPIQNGKKKDLNQSLNKKFDMRKVDLFGLRS
jgi:hypothetical protein